MHNRLLRLPVMLVIISRGHIDDTFKGVTAGLLNALKKF